MNTHISVSYTKNKGLLFFLWLKIIMTLLVWSTPLLLPDPLLNKLTHFLFGIESFEPKIFFHLLGVAFLALTVSYYAGVLRLQAGKDFEHIVWVGIVSNGLITFLLLLYGFLGAYNEWLLIGQIYMWGSALITGAIAVGLLVTGILKNPSKN